MNNKLLALSGSLFLLPGLAFTSATHAAGFQTQQQNATGLGRAWAGEGVIGDNASVQYYNPAGQTLLKKVEFTLGANYIAPDSKFKHEITTLDASGLNLASTEDGSIQGNDGGNFGNSKLIPYGYITVPFAEKFRAGLGIHTKFGIGTEYDSNFYGRFHGTKSDLTTIFFTPSLAYELNEQWSLGASISVVNAEAELVKATPTFTTSIPPAYTNFDVETKLEGDDTGIGWSIGATYALNNDTRFGINYNSEIDLKLTGKVTTDPNIGSWDAYSEITLPQQLTLDGYHKISNFGIHGTIGWVGWSSFKEIAIKDTGGNNLSVPEAHNWKDSWRVSVGGSYYLNPIWELRAGIQWDQSPIPEETRTVRIPADDRWNFGLGFTAQATEYFSVDFGYMYAYQSNAKVNQTTVIDPASGVTATTTGESEIGIHVVGLQTNFAF